MTIDNWINIAVVVIAAFTFYYLLKQDRINRKKSIGELVNEKLQDLTAFLKLEERVKVLETSENMCRIGFKEELKEIKISIDKLFTLFNGHVYKD